MPAMKKVVHHVFVSPLFMFSILIFFIGLGDAIMSYITPVYIAETTGSAFMMGLVLSFSSLVGIVFDIFISERQWHKSYRFFIKLTLLATILFPLTLLMLPASYFTFVIAMFIWGAYYEYRGFASFNFIRHFLSKEQHTSGWAMLSAFGSFAYFLGPLVAANITDLGFKFTFATALLPFILAFFVYKIFTDKFSTRQPSGNKLVKEERKSLLIEFKILTVLWSRVWPLLLFSFLILLVDACFWTVGTLLSEDLKQTSKLGSLLLAAYMLPSVFVVGYASKISAKFGKKRTAFIAGLISSLFLAAVGSVQSVASVLVLVFMMSVFSSIALVLQSAVVEDYVSRLTEFGDDMISIEQMAHSFAYIVGPVVLGYISDIVGHQKTFALTGVLLGIVSVLCLFIVPRKIKMPQTELKEIMVYS